jgi:hypothetical protein
LNDITQRVLRHALIAFALMTSSAWAGAKLVVLEAIGPADTTPAQAAYWTDVVRGVVRARLPARITVLTRENIKAFLPPDVDLADCEGECEISTGRKIGAEYVMGVRVLPSGETWAITVALHATIDGRFLGQGQVTVPKADIDNGLREAAHRAVQSLAPDTPSQTSALEIEEITARPLRWIGAPIVRVESALAVPFTITANGRPVGNTPVNLLLDGAKAVVVTAAARGFQTRRFRIVTGGGSGAATLDLPSARGSVRLKVPFEDVEVHFGSRSLQGRRHTLEAGTYTVHVKHRCLVATAFEATVVADTYIDLEVPHRLTCGRVRITSPVPQATVIWRGLPHPLPFDGPVEPPTTTDITVQAPGHLPLKTQVTTPAVGTQTLDLPLTLDTVEVLVEVRRWNHDPCNAPVFIDGEQVGTSPWRGPVRVGRRVISTQCGQSMQRAITLPSGSTPRRVRFTQPGHIWEVMATTTRLNSALLTARVWTSPHRQGVVRAGAGVVLGSYGFRHHQEFGLGLEFGLGVTLTDQLELGTTAMGTVGTRTCTDAEAEGRSVSERNFGCLHAYGELRGLLRYYHGRAVLEGGWAWTGQSHRGDPVTGWGPHLGLGISF